MYVFTKRYLKFVQNKRKFTNLLYRSVVQILLSHDVYASKAYIEYFTYY